MTLYMPVTKSTINQMNVTGENIPETFAVPKRWIRKRAAIKAMDIGPMFGVKEGTERAIPPTAEVTETAGVNMPSANVRAVPNKAYANQYQHAIRES